ncbi:MAG: D-alanyl-D-alanine carboxypeptidase, partial [Clostridiales bacterium]|nr:D-alanyl-D-alanine carboxypeptidase [Clostridiales bacterium]
MRKNKRIIAIFLSLMMLISSGVFVNNAHAAQAKPTVYAHSYTVMDANSGEIIISGQENKRIYPASTIKLLTAIVAIENCSLYKRITV